MARDQIVWTESNSVGVASLDEQHRRLVEVTNRLFQEIINDTGTEAVFAVLDEVARYAEYHFAHEEALLVEHGYPADELERHAAEHRALEAQVHELIARARQDNSLIDLEVYDFLRDWTNDHMHGSDKRYATFLAARGAL